MKDIKFRAWSKAEEKMYLPEKSDMLSINFLGGVSYGGDTWADDMVLMQYTGLKDKNGREIYEGDIVKEQGARINNLPAAPFFKEIVFYEGKFMAKDVGIDDPQLYINIAHSSYNEVLGNIYENPELLKPELLEKK